MMAHSCPLRTVHGRNNLELLTTSSNFIPQKELAQVSSRDFNLALRSIDKNLAHTWRF